MSRQATLRAPDSIDRATMVQTISSVRRAIVFAPFFYTEFSSNRPRIAASILAEFMPVDVVTSDFDHLRKTKRGEIQCRPFAKVVYLKVRPYRTNVSVGRLVSHLLFALEAARYFRQNRNKYDVVYATTPLNTLAWLLFTLAGKRTKIVDVVDIWPDVLPFSFIQRLTLAPVLAVWRWFFRSAISKCDLAMAVSDEFTKEASRYASRQTRVRRFYIGCKKLASDIQKQSIFTIAYVGNLGRVYDFDTLIDVLSDDQLRANVQLFVIGEGDRQKWLIGELEKRHIRYRFFGIVYDNAQLADILSSCHVGFNGYLNTTAAFSYKANTYLAAGLPIINSMKGDLHRLVDKYGLGKNYRGGSRVQLKECLLRLQQEAAADMSLNCKQYFAAYLDEKTIATEIRAYYASHFGNSGGIFCKGR